MNEQPTNVGPGLDAEDPMPDPGTTESPPTPAEPASPEMPELQPAAAEPASPEMPEPALAMPVRLAVGATFGRALDAVAAAWPVLAGVVAAGALVASLSNLVSTDQVATTVVLALVATALSLLGTVAGAIVVADLHAGRRPAIGPALRRGLGRIVAALLSVVAQALGVVGIAVPGTIVIAIGVALRAPAVVLLGLVGVLVLVIVVVLRWFVAVPAIAIDGLGPIEALRRSWHLTRRSIRPLLGIGFLTLLVTGPLTMGGGLIAAFVDPLLGVLALFAATVITAPLLTAVLTETYLALTGRAGVAAADPAADPTDVAPGEIAAGQGTASDVTAGRRPARPIVVAVMLGLGLVVLGGGLFAAGSSVGQVRRPDPGVVVFGTSPNPSDPCRPNDRGVSFSPQDEIYLGAALIRRIPTGEEIVVELLYDGELVFSEPVVGSGPFGVDCYYEAEPFRDTPPGDFEVVIRHAGDVVARGSFTVR